MTPPQLPVYPSVPAQEPSTVFSEISPEPEKPGSHESLQRLKRQARAAVDRQRIGLANRIQDYGTSVRSSADSWRSQDSNLAWVANRVADRVDRAADYFRESEIEDIKADAESFVRSHPLLVYGGLFVGGLVVANFLKASQKPLRAEGAIDLAPRRLPLADQPEQDPWPSTPRGEIPSEEGE